MNNALLIVSSDKTQNAAKVEKKFGPTARKSFAYIVPDTKKERVQLSVTKSLEHI